MLIKLLYTVVLGAVILSSCTSTDNRTVRDVMDETITELYKTKTEDQLLSLSNDQVISLFSEKDLEILATRHWMFDVNVPVVVSVYRSVKQEFVPFWLQPEGFSKTGMTVKNEMTEYEVWQKSFGKGSVGLGINGFENYGLHYFVSVGPQNKADELQLSNFFPENQYVDVLGNGSFTYHDWDELVLSDIPEELKGQKLLTTIRGRGVESHLVKAFRKTAYPSSTQPDQVMLTWSSDPKNSIDIQWRTDTTIYSGAVNYREKGSSEVFSVNALKYRMEDLRLMNDRFINRFTAQIKNLKPGTTYEYQVAPETGWNENYTFTTPAEDDSFSFIWFGDVHHSPIWGELVNKAHENHPDVAFLAFVGDMVGDGLHRNEWDDLFEFPKNIISQKPVMMTLGNHDTRSGLGALMYRELFSYPKNGPEDVNQEHTYSFTYKNALYLMIDATSPIEKQSKWIEEQLANTSATWKFAIFHFPPYNFNEPYPDIQQAWVPLFDKYHVDMVFGGHIHYYMRSKPMKAGEVVDSYNNGTAYIISIGIPSRSRDIGEEPYAAVRYGEGQYYQYIRINGNELSYTAVDADGKVADSFNIKK
jgi:acid phosphatase type 7